MDAAAFLTLAAALSVPSGYSYGALLLLVLGLCAWPGVLAGRVRWTPPLALWGTAIAVMGLVWGMHIVDDSGRLVTHSLGLDRCIKYLLVLLCLPALLVGRPGVPALRWGCAIGAIGAGLTALWEVLAKGLARADGYTNSIQFGNLALLLGVWSGVWALHADTPRQRAAGWLGTALGLTASLASGSRGGWVTLPLLVLLGLWLSPPLTRGGAHASMQRRGVRALGLTAALCALLVMLPPVQQRAELAAHEYLQQEQSVGESSVGLRLAFWQLAWTQGLAHPWVGVGQGDYEKPSAAPSRGRRCRGKPCCSTTRTTNGWTCLPSAACSVCWRWRCSTPCPAGCSGAPCATPRAPPHRPRKHGARPRCAG